MDRRAGARILLFVTVSVFPDLANVWQQSRDMVRENPLQAEAQWRQEGGGAAVGESALDAEEELVLGLLRMQRRTFPYLKVFNIFGM